MPAYYEPKGTIKLTPAQRRALETIAKGGVAYNRARFGDRKWLTVPDGAQKITPAVYKRLHDLDLITGEDPVKLTDYGRDLLAGTIRPPIDATATITLDGNTITTIPIQLDPYARQLNDPDDRASYLERIGLHTRATRITVTIDAPPPPTTKDTKPATRRARSKR